MTPEQKQLRIEQIEGQREWRQNHAERFKMNALIAANDDIDFLLSLVKSQEVGGDIEDAETTAPQSFKWPKPTLAGYDYALSMAELNGFDNVTDAIVTAVRLRDAGIGLIQVVAEEIAADLGYQGGTENQQELAKKIQDAMNRTAISMRSACVEELKELARERVGQSKPNHKDHEYDQAVAFVLLQAAEKLETLSIEKQS